MSTDETDDEASSDDAGSERPKRRRRVLMFFSAGLVLGLIVLSSLAVYSDSVYGKSDFRTGHWAFPPGWLFPWQHFHHGKWGVQGNYSLTRADGQWDEFDTIPEAGEFQFPLQALSLNPGDTVYAPVSLRVNPRKDRYAAKISLQGGTTADPNRLFNALEYRVGRSSAANCVAGDIGLDIPGWPGYLGTRPAIWTGSDPLQPIVLPRNSEPFDLCFAVTLPDSYRGGGMSSTVLWRFVAQAVI